MAATVALIAGAIVGHAIEPRFQEAARPAAAANDDLQRGRYLTERVAMCIQCHSPRDDDGRLLYEQKFQGAPIPVQGPAWRPDWAVEAPAIAGLTFYTREQFVRLLTKGVTRDGDPPSPPMPPFRMSEADAKATYDYLASLPED